MILEYASDRYMRYSPLSVDACSFFPHLSFRSPPIRQNRAAVATQFGRFVKSVPCPAINIFGLLHTTLVFHLLNMFAYPLN